MDISALRVEPDAPPSETAIAVAAAESAVSASAELLRFAREGARSDHFALDEGTVEQLADALRQAITIEYPRIAASKDKEGASMMNQLQGGLTRFLEGWA